MPSHRHGQVSVTALPTLGDEATMPTLSEEVMALHAVTVLHPAVMNECML